MPDEYFCSKEDGLINRKKFYGLDVIKDKYEYIIAIDDDCVINSGDDLYEICKNWFNDKELLGNKIINDDISIPMIIKNCKSYFNKEDKRKINIETNNLYLWFNQPCIYKADTIKDFFEYTNVLNSLNSVSYYDFEYYIYMFYLIVKYDFKVKDLNIVGEAAACELLDKCVLDDNQKKSLSKALQLTPYMANQLNNWNGPFIIHVDRKPGKVNLKGKIKNKIKKVLYFYKYLDI